MEPAHRKLDAHGADAVTRTQHAVELLLPSGAVFVAGGQYGDGSGNQTTYQEFKPPYFFNGPRPSITLLPPVVHYNTGFNVVTPEAATSPRFGSSVRAL